MKFSDIKIFHGVIAIAIWSVSIPLIKQASITSSTGTILGISFILGGFLSLLLSLSKNTYKTSLFFRRNFLLRAILFSIYFKLYYFSISIIPKNQIALLTFTNYLWPTITTVLVVIFLKPKVHFFLFSIGMSLVIAGIFLEFRFTDFKNISYLPILLTFIAAVAWALYNLLSKLNTDNTNMVPIFMLITGFSNLNQIEFNINIFSIPHLPYLAIAPAIANIFWEKGIRHNIVLLSLLADFLPWLSLICSYFILDIDLHLRSLMTLTLVIIGAMISRFCIKL